MARTATTDMNNEMNEIATSGFDMGFYPSFLDGDRKKFGFENEDSFGFNEEHGCHGLFTELGFSEEIPVPQWSLVEQLGMASCINNPCLEDILDEACSPLSVASVESSFSSESCVPSLEDIVEQACSPLSATSTEMSFPNETCVQSPFSDSGISCSPPYSPTGLEELDSGVWAANELAETIDWSAFQFFTDNCKEAVAESNATSKEDDVCVIVPEKIVPQIFEQIDNTDAMSVVQQVEVSSDETGEVIMPIESSEETEPLTPIAPAPVGGGKIIVVKAVSVRTVPYRKPKSGKRQKTKEQKDRKKNQNRDAALRYRSKRKEELQDLFDEASQLEESNKGLNEKVTGLQKEIDYLKSLMLDVIKARLSKDKLQT